MLFARPTDRPTDRRNSLAKIAAPRNTHTHNTHNNSSLAVESESRIESSRVVAVQPQGASDVDAMGPSLFHTHTRTSTTQVTADKPSPINAIYCSISQPNVSLTIQNPQN
jgi:hypothetical protein